MDVNSAASINSPLHLTDLCDDVLFKIFTYLNLNDRIRLPLVCKRFRCFIQQNNLPLSTTSSMEVEALSKRNFNYDRVFERIASHLKTFTIDSNGNAFEVNLILKSARKYCHNIKTMAFRTLYANAVKSVPKSLNSLTVEDFRGKCLNLTELTHLTELSLKSNHALDEIKVHRPLKVFHLELQLRDRMPDHANINRLTTMVSETFDVAVHSDYSDAGYLYAGRIHTITLNDLNQIMNLKLFTMHLFYATIVGINPTNIRSTKMLCNCGHFVPLSMNTLNRFLNNYNGPDRTLATKVVRYTPGTSFTIQFDFDDCEDRYKYFERLRFVLANQSKFGFY